MAAQNLPATQMKEVRYLVEGREIVLTADLVKKYLVRGHGELMSGQEVAFFVGICRARGLDPFAGDVYVIKYAANDPAAIVISIDAVRARARMQDDCLGWTCGVIVQTKEGDIRDTAGLVLEGQKLVGGWAECTPKGWAVPMRLEVNLAAYIKKTSTGTITKFWEPDKQPMMITKVAEMQLLRRIWPAALGKLYLQEEVGIADMGDGPSIDMEPQGNGGAGAWEEKPGEESISDKLERLAKENGISDLADLKKFIAASAKATNKTEDELMAAACENFTKFLEIYMRQLQKKKEREEMEAKAKKKAAEPKAQATGQEENPIDRARRMKGAKQNQVPTLESEWGEPNSGGPFPEDPPKNVDPQTGEVLQRDSAETKDCPEDGEPRAFGWCRKECPSFQDCLIWGKK